MKTFQTTRALSYRPLSKLNQRCHSFKEEKGCFLPQATTPKLDPSKWQVRHHERAIGPSHVRLIALSRQPTGECEVWPRLHGTPSGWCYEGNARNKDEVEDDVRISALLHLRPRHERHETRACRELDAVLLNALRLQDPVPAQLEITGMNSSAPRNSSARSAFSPRTLLRWPRLRRLRTRDDDSGFTKPSLSPKI